MPQQRRKGSFVYVIRDKKSVILYMLPVRGKVYVKPGTTCKPEQFWKDWDREICLNRFRPPKPGEKDILKWEKMHKA